MRTLFSVSLLGALLASCSFISDLEVKQCAKDGDCAKYGAVYEDYTCQREVCVPFACSNDQQCQARGGDFANFLCTGNECVPPDCIENEDCRDLSPTATCAAGRCQQDEAWACVFDGERPTATKSTLTFRAKVIDFQDRMPPEGLVANVCRRADPTCTLSPDGPYTLDEDGFINLTFRDVPSTGFDGFIRMESPGNMPLEFQFASPLVRDFSVGDEAPLVVVPTIAIEGFGLLLGMEFDAENSSLMTMRLFDCQGNPAPGLRLTATPPGGAIFYSADSTFVPTVDAESTGNDGIGGLANVSPGLPVIGVVDNASGSELFNFALSSRAGTLILTFVYAQDR